MTNLDDLKEQVKSTSYDPRLLALVLIAIAEQLERIANAQQK